MIFPHDIWGEIFSYFHSSYKKPLHLEEFKSIRVKHIWNKLESKIYSIMNYNYTLYRFLMDITIWLPVYFNIGKWSYWMKFLINDNAYNISNLNKSNKRVCIDFMNILYIYEGEYHRKILGLD